MELEEEGDGLHVFFMTILPPFGIFKFKLISDNPHVMLRLAVYFYLLTKQSVAWVT